MGYCSPISVSLFFPLYLGSGCSAQPCSSPCSLTLRGHLTGLDGKELMTALRPARLAENSKKVRVSGDGLRQS